MNEITFCVPVCVAPQHPCLAGHFPGEPIVPGVLLLEHVALALRAWRDQRLVRVVEAKFLAPLRPAETARLTLTQSPERVRFEIHREDVVIARGVIEGML
jgi:3-hydroxyacyl-[acyl-carrier-protein] dehydratase